MPLEPKIIATLNTMILRLEMMRGRLKARLGGLQSTFDADNALDSAIKEVDAEIDYLHQCIKEWESL